MSTSAYELNQKLEDKGNRPYDELFFNEEAYKVDDELTLEFADCGGAEGDGAMKWVVFKVGEQYFRMTGYHSSWGESDWDGELTEVVPKQVMRTEYEDK